ncbi:MAG: response regulator [Labilithrix sp.]|nr:response regulator [Labilithrix sp.]
MTSSASPARPTVLVVEDEAALRRVLRAALDAHGYDVFDAGTARQGIDRAAQHRPDVVLLDLGLPDLGGMAVLRRLRAWSRAAIIVLSVRSGDDDKIAALDAGADDYLTKPFATGELLARMRAALRHVARLEGDAEPAIDVGDLRVDLARQQAFVRDRPIHLSPKEYALFATLMKHAGRVLTHGQLALAVWGPGHAQRVETLRVHMAGLRRKLEPDPARPRYLVAEPGVGYRLRVDG